MYEQSIDPLDCHLNKKQILDILSTLEPQIIGGVGIIGGLDIVIIINNKGVGIIGGVGRG